MQNNYNELFKSLYKGTPKQELICNDELFHWLNYHKIDMVFFGTYGANDYPILKDKLEQVNIKQSILYKNAIEIQNILRDNNIQFIFLKGITLSLDIYENHYYRNFSDIDILINEPDIDRTVDLLKSLNYVFAIYDHNKKGYIECLRKVVLEKRMYSHEMPDLIRQEENGFISQIDLNFKFTWTENNNQIPFDVIIKNTKAVYYENSELTQLNEVYNFIHLCCHLYNEAVFFIARLNGRKLIPDDLKLIHILDLIYIILKGINFDEIINAAQKHGLFQAIYYCLKIISKIDSTIIPQSVFDMKKDCMVDEHINYYIDANGNKANWNIDILDRLIDLNKRALEITRIIDL